MIKYYVTAIFMVAAMTISSSGFAQDSATTAAEAPAQEKEPVKDESVEKIEVTGSHIKRIDVEGPSPVLVLDREHLDRSGYNSISDVLRDTSINSHGSRKETVGSTVAGTSNVSLRGLGGSRTLVLLNGKRLATDAVTGDVDLNIVPMAAVERIEILKDGASATYGSDAVGGVVNIITKKDFSGTEASIQYSVPEKEGGIKTTASVVSGYSGSKGNITAVFYYRDNKRIWARNREWTERGESPTGSPGSYAQDNGTPGNPDPGIVSPGPNCPDDRKVDFGATEGTYCTYNYNNLATSHPDLTQYSLFTDFNYKLPMGMTGFGRVGGTKKLVKWEYAPAPGGFQIAAADAADLDGGGPLPGMAGNDVFAIYRMAELGNRVSDIRSDSFNVLLGTKGEVGETWEWEVSSGYNRTDRLDKSVSGYALEADIQAKLGGDVAGGEFNPFAPPGQRGDLGDILYVPTQSSISDIVFGEMKFTGELMDSSSGPIGAAVGVSHSKEVYKDDVDQKTVDDEVFSNAGSDGGGGRSSYSVSTEVSVPFGETVETQIALRFDRFSDFGDTVNPKLGIRWQASPKWMLRASAGTGFKAPRMVDLYASKSKGFPTFIDKKACADNGGSSCNPRQWLVFGGGNENLEEEKFVSANLGTVYQATSDFSVGLDVWAIKMENIINDDARRLEAITEAELRGLDIAGAGVIIDRTVGGNINNNGGGMKAPLLNLGALETNGIDLTIEYTHGSSFGRFRYKIEHSHMFTYKTELFPGLGFEDELGNHSKPAWRNTATAMWAPNQNHDTSLMVHSVGKNDYFVKEKGYIAIYHEVDAQYNYHALFSGTLTVGVKNLLGTRPQLDESNVNGLLDQEIYNNIGRFAYLGYKYQF